MARHKRMTACRWTLMAGLLAGCGLQHGSELGFRSAATDGKTFKTGFCCGLTVAPDHRGFTSQLPRGVRERRRQVSESRAGDETKQLTTDIKKAGTASKLLAVLDAKMDGAVLDHIHVSAALIKLARFKKRRQLQRADAKHTVLAKLISRLHDMLQQKLLSPWSSANAFYAMSELYQELGTCVKPVLPRLSEAVAAKAAGMNEQGISNCLLSAAKLQGASPDVLTVVRPLVKQIRAKASCMNCQDLANCVWAAAKLQETSPAVLTAVPALAKHMLDKVKGMTPQELSNSLCAVAMLQEPVPQALAVVPVIVQHMQETIHAMNSQDLCNNFWAVGKLKDASPDMQALAQQLIERIRPVISTFAREGLRMSLWAAQQFREEELAADLQAALHRLQR